jgi:hypothetical protein
MARTVWLKQWGRPHCFSLSSPPDVGSGDSRGQGWIGVCAGQGDSWTAGQEGHIPAAGWRYRRGMSSDAERAASLAEWTAAVGEPDQGALRWAREAIERIKSDQPAARAS